MTALPDLARRAARLAAPPPPWPKPAEAPPPVARRAARPVPRGRLVVFAVLLLAAGVFGAVSLDALAAESAFEATRLEAEVDALSMRHDELIAEVARLESPAHVRQIASEELGMVPADGAVYLGEPAPAGVATAARSRNGAEPGHG